MKQSSRSFVALLVAALGLASAGTANAASVVLSATSFGVPAGSNLVIFGNPFTLTVTVTADAGEIDTSVFGVIQYQNALVSPVAQSQHQNALPPTANGPWNQGVLPACTTINCRAFAQTNAGGAVGVTNFVIATMQFVFTGPIGGIATFRWQSAPLSQRIDFFGVTSAPGISLTVIDGPVPEPTTAALLGLGLVGLALARRRG